MIRVFFDASVLFAASYSKTGSSRDLLRGASYISLKDAPVVAGAIKAGVDYLVTWDRKHFVEDTRMARESGLKIVTPDEAMALIGT